MKRQGSSAPASGNRTRALVLGGVAVLAIVAIVIALVASGGDDDSASGAEQETAPVTVDGASLPAFTENGEPDDAIGEVAPTVSGESFDRSPVSIGGGTGSPQILVFLSHSCPHCQAEVPRIVEAADAGTFDGVEVVGIATNTSDTLPNYPPSSWLEGERWPFPVLLDDGRGTAGTAYGLTAFPFFVFVDADGNVVGRVTGELSTEDLELIADTLRAGDPLPLPGGDGGSTQAGSAGVS